MESAYSIRHSALTVRCFAAFEHRVGEPVFPPDGRRLAIALGGGQGARVLDVATGRELMADAYVRDRVKQRTGGERSPIIIRPTTVPDFAFAVVR